MIWLFITRFLPTLMNVCPLALLRAFFFFFPALRAQQKNQRVEVKPLPSHSMDPG
jgi:hypothetical protein